MSVDYSCLFPTGMLNIGLHPQKEMETELCWAYNRWVTEKVLPESGGRMFSMLCLPFSDPDATLRHVETFGHRKGVGGFMVTTVRTCRCTTTRYMKVYRAIEERGLVLSFHSASIGTRTSSAAATASSRCMRSGSRSTTSFTAPTGW